MKRALLVIALLAIAPVLLSAANGADLKVRVAVQTANIRSGPEMTASVVQTAKVGSVFPVIRKSGDWYLIQLETGGQAYIHATVVEEVTEPEAAPVKPAEKPPAKPAQPASTPAAVRAFTSWGASKRVCDGCSSITSIFISCTGRTGAAITFVRPGAMPRPAPTRRRKRRI